MASSEKTNLDALFDNPALIVDAVADAARRAVLDHKFLGNPIAEWRDGHVVLTPPEEIEIDESSVPPKLLD